jgi:hypothetical protein
MKHLYLAHFDDDGDYIVFVSLTPHGEWIEHMRWMIPGTQIED